MKKFKLKTVGVEITWNCNQHCSYCYLACSKDAYSIKKNIELDFFGKILDKIWSAGVREVYLIGGEPTLHPEFAEIVKMVNGYNWRRKGLCSNGVGLDNEKINLIRNNFDYIAISLRGAEETTKRITKNKKSFCDTISTLSKLSKSKIEIRVEVDLLPENFNEFPGIIEVLKKNKINLKSVDMHRIIPIGSAKSKKLASLGEYQELLKTIDAISAREKYSIKFEDSFPLCLFGKKYWKYISKCKCGTSKIWIDPRGMVRRCACSSGAIGDIKKQDLDQIWNSKVMSRYHSFKWIDKKCKKCKVLSRCLGGCSSSRGVKFFKKDLFSDFVKAIG